MRSPGSILASSLPSALLAARAGDPAAPDADATKEAATGRSDMVCGRE